jgi:hypothetical protein
MPVANREPGFHNLAVAQNQIGWQHILKGRFSHHWIQIQQYLINNQPDIGDTKQSGERWLRLVINQLWTSLWQVWQTRNNDLHGRDKTERERKRLEKLTPQVVALYDTVDRLLANDKIIFETPITERLKTPSRELETWIKLVKPTVKQAIADADAFILQTNHTLQTYLVTRPDPLTTDELVNELQPIPCMHHDNDHH